jgi:hypothetical protein
MLSFEEVLPPFTYEGDVVIQICLVLTYELFLVKSSVKIGFRDGLKLRDDME